MFSFLEHISAFSDFQTFIKLMCSVVVRWLTNFRLPAVFAKNFTVAQTNMSLAIGISGNDIEKFLMSNFRFLKGQRNEAPIALSMFFRK